MLGLKTMKLNSRETNGEHLSLPGSPLQRMKVGSMSGEREEGPISDACHWGAFHWKSPSQAALSFGLSIICKARI